MNDEIRSKQLYSGKLRAVFMSLKEKPCTIDEIISEVFKQKVSLWRPRQDVIGSLKILELMDFVKKRIDGNRRIYEKINPVPSHDFDVYVISHGLEIILKELDKASQEKSIDDLRSAMKGFSENDINAILKLLEKKAQIKIKDGKIQRNVTVYTYKKTSD